MGVVNQALIATAKIHLIKLDLVIYSKCNKQKNIQAIALNTYSQKSNISHHLSATLTVSPSEHITDILVL